LKDGQARGSHFAGWEDEQLLKRSRAIEKGNPMKIRTGKCMTQAQALPRAKAESATKWAGPWIGQEI